MTHQIKIAIDLDGGDLGFEPAILASISFLNSHPDASLLCYGVSESIEAIKKRYPNKIDDRIQLIECDEAVRMDDKPSDALRRKKTSTMARGVDSIKEKKAHAFVSSGNTGALMLLSSVALKLIEGIERPAIVTMLPGKKTPFLMLDLGANTECTSENLIQFAKMGNFLARDLLEKENPVIALLNIGEEHHKGHSTIKDASEKLRNSEINYHGYIEANEMFSGRVDVVVCDGFTGNVALKSIEGTAGLIKAFIQNILMSNLFYKFLSIFTLPVLAALRKKMDPRRYNGAMLIGLNGIVIKSHGSSDEIGFRAALEIAYKESKSDIVNKILRNVSR